MYTHTVANDPPKSNSTITRKIKVCLISPGIYTVFSFLNDINSLISNFYTFPFNPVLFMLLTEKYFKTFPKHNQMILFQGPQGL